jgi:photosystem II stability/assembly factor-like uncharacterized protein
MKHLLYVVMISGLMVFIRTGSVAQNFWQATVATNPAGVRAASDGILYSQQYILPSMVLFRSASNGVVWDSVFTSPGAAINSVNVNSRGYVFLTTEGAGCFRSTDLGATWTAIDTGLTTTVTRAIAFGPSSDVYLGTRDFGVYRSTDDGAHWTNVITGLAEFDIASLAVDSSGNIFAGVKGTNGIYKSTDQGGHWSLTSMTNLFRVYAIAVHPNGHIFAGTQADPPGAPTPDGVYRSTDNGASWAQAGLTGVSIAGAPSIDFLRDGTLFVATDTGGVFTSTDEGSTWNAANTGLATRHVINIAVANDYLFAGTIAGIFRSVQPVMAVIGRVNWIRPAGVALYDGYPNPFNPTTVLGFQIPAAGLVRLDICDLSGRTVTTLVNGKMAPGYYEVRWDAARFASGLYFGRLQAGSELRTRKLLLVK